MYVGTGPSPHNLRILSSPNRSTKFFGRLPECDGVRGRKISIIDAVLSGLYVQSSDTHRTSLSTPHMEILPEFCPVLFVPILLDILCSSHSPLYIPPILRFRLYRAFFVVTGLAAPTIISPTTGCARHAFHKKWTRTHFGLLFPNHSWV